jgi:hypothetical protein
MELNWAASNAPLLSMMLPVTENILPSTSFPTGTLIGPPKSSATSPRARPSVADIATQRTRFSPMC